MASGSPRRSGQTGEAFPGSSPPTAGSSLAGRSVAGPAHAWSRTPASPSSSAIAAADGEPLRPSSLASGRRSGTEMPSPYEPVGPQGLGRSDLSCAARCCQGRSRRCGRRTLGRLRAVGEVEDLRPRHRLLSAAPGRRATWRPHERPARSPGGTTLLVVGHDLTNVTEGHGGPSRARARAPRPGNRRARPGETPAGVTRSEPPRRRTRSSARPIGQPAFALVALVGQLRVGLASNLPTGRRRPHSRAPGRAAARGTALATRGSPRSTGASADRRP
jgi:hypothetical protein